MFGTIHYLSPAGRGEGGGVRISLEGLLGFQEGRKRDQSSPTEYKVVGACKNKVSFPIL